MSKHTPFRIGMPTEHSEDAFNPNTIYDSQGVSVCTVFGLPLNWTLAKIKNDPQSREGLERAAFIVRACNSHEALLAALENLLDRYVSVVVDNLNWNPSTEQEVIDTERAIAKAKGEAQ